MDNSNQGWDCFITMKKWMENRNAGKMFSQYFHDYGYASIAIYGAGDIGRLLYEELRDSSIDVKYWVDRNGEGLAELDGVKVITLPEINQADKVDALVVTPLGNYEEICRDLVKICPELPTISLREAVYEF